MFPSRVTLGIRLICLLLLLNFPSHLSLVVLCSRRSVHFSDAQMGTLSYSYSFNNKLGLLLSEG